MKFERLTLSSKLCALLIVNPCVVHLADDKVDEDKEIPK